MRSGVSVLGCAIACATFATPAMAWDFAQIPEPSNMVLFGMGLVGLIVGRQASKVRRGRKD